MTSKDQPIRYVVKIEAANVRALHLALYGMIHEYEFVASMLDSGASSGNVTTSEDGFEIEVSRV